MRVTGEMRPLRFGYCALLFGLALSFYGWGAAALVFGMGIDVKVKK